MAFPVCLCNNKVTSFCSQPKCSIRFFCQECKKSHHHPEVTDFSEWMITKVPFDLAEQKINISKEFSSLQEAVKSKAAQMKEINGKLQLVFKGIIPFYLDQIRQIMEKVVFILKVNMSRLNDSNQLIQSELKQLESAENFIMENIKQKKPKMDFMKIKKNLAKRNSSPTAFRRNSKLQSEDLSPLSQSMFNSDGNEEEINWKFSEGEGSPERQLEVSSRYDSSSGRQGSIEEQLLGYEEKLNNLYKKKVDFLEKEIKVLVHSISSINFEKFLEKSQRVTFNTLASSFEAIAASLSSEINIEDSVKALREKLSRNKPKKAEKTPVFSSPGRGQGLLPLRHRPSFDETHEDLEINPLSQDNTADFVLEESLKAKKARDDCGKPGDSIETPEESGREVLCPDPEENEIKSTPKEVFQGSRKARSLVGGLLSRGTSESQGDQPSKPSLFKQTSQTIPVENELSNEKQPSSTSQSSKPGFVPPKLGTLKKGNRLFSSVKRTMMQNQEENSPDLNKLDVKSVDGDISHDSSSDSPDFLFKPSRIRISLSSFRKINLVENGPEDKEKSTEDDKTQEKSMEPKPESEADVAPAKKVLLKTSKGRGNLLGGGAKTEFKRDKIKNLSLVPEEKPEDNEEKVEEAQVEQLNNIEAKAHFKEEKGSQEDKETLLLLSSTEKLVLFVHENGIIQQPFSIDKPEADLSFVLYISKQRLPSENQSPIAILAYESLNVTNNSLHVFDLKEKTTIIIRDHVHENTITTLLLLEIHDCSFNKQNPVSFEIEKRPSSFIELESASERLEKVYSEFENQCTSQLSLYKVRFVSGSLEPIVRMWEFTKNTDESCKLILLNEFKLEKGGVFAMIHVELTQYNLIGVAAGTSQKSIHCWKASKEEIKGTSIIENAHKEKINSITKINSKSFATAASDGMVKFWDYSTLSNVKTLNNGAAIWSCLFLGGNCIATTVNDMRLKSYIIKIWNYETEQVKSVIKEHKSRIVKLELLNQSCMLSLDKGQVVMRWKIQKNQDTNEVSLEKMADRPPFIRNGSKSGSSRELKKSTPMKRISFGKM